jgi:hypothetical protein
MLFFSIRRRNSLFHEPGSLFNPKKQGYNPCRLAHLLPAAFFPANAGTKQITECWILPK